MIKDFLYEEDALGTVELLLILAGLVSIAIVFKKQLFSFMKGATASVFTNGADKNTGVVQDASGL